MHKLTVKLAPPLFAAFVIAGCGGGGGTAATPPTVAIAPISGATDNADARGTLIQNPPQRILSLTVPGVVAQLNLFGTFGADLLTVGGAPKCGIDFHHFEYGTVGAVGEPATASGALMVPTGSDPACTGKRPVLLYAHGTSSARNFNIAGIDDLSNDAAGDAAMLAALYAAQGYIVVAPNYAGYDTSNLSYHPYHNADQQSKDMIDALASARKALPNLINPVADSGQLFIAGYSQGGHVAMATHRAMQAAGMTVTASVGQSGAYALSEIVDTIFNGKPNFGIEEYLALLSTSYQKAYGNLYTTPSDVYTAAYATGIETLSPSPGGGLRAPFVFGTDAPNYASVGAAFQRYYGPPAQSLVKTSYLTQALGDIAANPCPSNSASAPLNCAPANGFRAAAVKNDLRTWTPIAPMLLCGGNGDPVVPFVSAQLTQAYFLAHGARVPTLDVDSPVTANDPYAFAKSIFLLSKQYVVDRAGGNATEALFEYYHSYMVANACGVAARDFFKTF